MKKILAGSGQFCPIPDTLLYQVKIPGFGSEFRVNSGIKRPVFYERRIFGISGGLAPSRFSGREPQTGGEASVKAAFVLLLIKCFAGEEKNLICPVPKVRVPDVCFSFSFQTFSAPAVMPPKPSKAELPAGHSVVTRTGRIK